LVSYKCILVWLTSKSHGLYYCSEIAQL
jgi:hypothetical protein